MRSARIERTRDRFWPMATVVIRWRVRYVGCGFVIHCHKSVAKRWILTDVLPRFRKISATDSFRPQSKSKSEAFRPRKRQVRREKRWKRRSVGSRDRSQPMASPFDAPMLIKGAVLRSLSSAITRKSCGGWNVTSKNHGNRLPSGRPGGRGSSGRQRSGVRRPTAGLFLRVTPRTSSVLRRPS